MMHKKSITPLKTSNLKRGKLQRWNDDKGFGFIEVETNEEDVFIHISAFKKMVRRPLNNDIILFQLHKDNDGKTKAINAVIEGLEVFSNQNINKDYLKAKDTHRQNNRVISKFVLILIVLLVAVGIFEKFQPIESTSNKSQVQDFSSDSGLGAYSCEGKAYCSEMTSCEEAKFYLRNCPGTKLDGDGDGKPCESQWCNGFLD